MDISKLKILEDMDIAGKRVLLRVAYDFSLKQDAKGKWVAPEHTRIKATIPTIKYLLDKGCSIGLLSWMKRPKGEVVEELRMKPVAEKLSEMLGRPVAALSDCMGMEVEAHVRAMNAGDIVMLENVRFHKEEDEDDANFAKALTAGFELIVFDAFAQAHRACPSVTGIFDYLPGCAGPLMKKELEILGRVTDNPEHPFVVVQGGAKIADKVQLLKNFLSKADCVLIGGALANTFLKARGIEVGKSVMDDAVAVVKDAKDPFEIAKEILAEHSTTLSLGDAQVYKVQLPIDLLAAPALDSKESVVVNIDKGETIPEGYMYLDVGPRTISLYMRALKGARLVFMNGPMGYFENEEFAKGTQSLGQGIIDSGAMSVVAGGDTETIVKRYKWENKFTHASTGGGAALELLSGVDFPVLKYLTK